MDLFPLIAAERVRLAAGLDDLDDAEWEAPSLCAGWSVHVVAAHLNVPWEVSVPAMLFEVACVAGLRDHADSRFTPPGSGPEAPLTDVIVHGTDMLVPTGRSVDVDPVALATSLEFLAGGRAKGFVPRGLTDGLAFEASDLDVRVGRGRTVVRGPALALCSAVCGRAALLDRLSGDGVPVLAGRL
jgi:hypothetical protein